MVFLSLTTIVTSTNKPELKEVLTAMAKATDFMMNTVSVNGGFIWKYSLDLNERYGEVKARKTMIWVEPPGTPTVGEMLIEAWLATGDSNYRLYAERVAETLIRGQLSCGGWHYFIDQDTIGMKAYYHDYLSTIWGWEEHTKYYGNATFDDETTVSATRFLLRLYSATNNIYYKKAVDKALKFILESQFPNGGWPQRSPAILDKSIDGHIDYTQCATFNDDVIHNNIMILLEAWKTLHNKLFLTVALKGMDFLILSQLPAPQSGWAQQYDDQLQPDSGRRFEIGTISTGETVSNIQHLFDYYRFTGDRKYLEPIPPALKWLEESAGKLPMKEYSHTYFYEMGSNRPIYMQVQGNGRGRYFEKTYNFENAYPYGHKMNIDFDNLRQEYLRISLLNKNVALAEFEHKFKIQRSEPVINIISSGLDYRTNVGNPDEIRNMIESLDINGGWVVQNEILDEHDFLHTAARIIPGYDTGTFVTRMYRLINYLYSLQ